MLYSSTYPYNLPLLPPSLDFKSPKILDLVIKARAELGELKGYSSSLPNQMLLLSPAIIKESLASSEIENVNTTIINVLQNQLFPEDEQRPPDKEVLRYRDAVMWGYENLEEYKLSTKMILGIHKSLLPDVHNEYRRVQNGIKNGATGEIVYMPPVASEIPRLLNNLENFMNIDGTEEMDPLIRCAISHYQFEAIHPFSDGNGRAGRIIMVLQLVNSSVLTFPMLFISGYINKFRSRYYQLLLEVTSEGKWEEFICFMLEGFYTQAKTTKELLFKIMELYYKQKSLLKADYKNIYSADLVESLIAYPLITPAKLSSELGIHRDTAGRYLKKLESGKLLESRKIGRYHFYVNRALLNILHSKVA